MTHYQTTSERNPVVNRERKIEDAVINSPVSLHGNYGDSLAIRNCRIHPNKRAGLVDVLLLPTTGPHKIVSCGM